ncbi:uncharacterized protein BDW43DRAFT_32148 [Aspergillus alliaceus]|uniref:uncharacterized protein n=1 Tax=Petromyces alliaceus TaxID=209559 RepID=UPI0012A6D7B1|nr:uncharacterized protein BDW43DRAFT_32148 [Aspergillus alliaceus]KAB8235400.1 hypothetical protein BDW43DRAFT_32148 [Aspergillus alliaceus]
MTIMYSPTPTRRLYDFDLSVHVKVTTLFPAISRILARYAVINHDRSSRTRICIMSVDFVICVPTLLLFVLINHADGVPSGERSPFVQLNSLLT